MKRQAQLALVVRRAMVGAVLAAAALTIFAAVSSSPIGDWTAYLIVGVLFGFGALGTMIVRRAENPIGWLFVLSGSSGVLGSLLFAYATVGLTVHPLPLIPWVISAAQQCTIGIVMPLPLVFLFFPDGALPSARWRPVLWAYLAGTVISTVFLNGQPVSHLTDGVRVANPLHVGWPAWVWSALLNVGGALAIGGGFLSIGALFVRYRRARGETRLQLRWLVVVVAVAAALPFVGLALWPLLRAAGMSGDQASGVGWISFVLLLTVGIPAAVSVGVFRYHLYDLDVVIRKTLVFGVLALFITVVYAAIVGGIGALVGSKSGALLSFAAAATLAVLFQPARDRARRLADRLVYGKRATPYEVLSDFSDRMSETYASEDVLPRMAEILRAGTGATTARAWLRVGTQLRPAASAGEAHETSPLDIAGDSLPEISAEHAFEVRHQGELLGALSVVMPPSDPMNPTKEKLVRHLASQAGLILRNVRLIEELRASRQRLVAAQDQERRKIERNLHDGAQQQIVALGVKLRLAQAIAGKDPRKARELVVQLRTEINDALENLGDLARGIYPPLLADEGLAAALKAQARKSSVSTTVESDAVGRYPPEVEASIYFCALEALQNVAKYAQATTAKVKLTADDGFLLFEIADDGAGFDAQSKTQGTGMQGMRDRLDAIGGSLEVRSASGEGTTIIGRVPTPSVEVAQ